MARPARIRKPPRSVPARGPLDADDGSARYVFFRYRILPFPKQEYISPAVESITGYETREFYEDPYLIYTIVHPDDLPMLLQLDPAGDANRPTVIRWVRKDRRVIWTRHLFDAIPGRGGEITMVEGVAQDITAGVIDTMGIEQPVIPVRSRGAVRDELTRKKPGADR